MHVWSSNIRANFVDVQDASSTFSKQYGRGRHNLPRCGTANGRFVGSSSFLWQCVVDVFSRATKAGGYSTRTSLQWSRLTKHDISQLQFCRILKASSFNVTPDLTVHPHVIFKSRIWQRHSSHTGNLEVR